MSRRKVSHLSCFGSDHHINGYFDSVAQNIILLLIAGILKKNSLAIDEAEEFVRISTFESLPKGGHVNIHMRPRRTVVVDT